MAAETFVVVADKLNKSGALWAPYTSPAELVAGQGHPLLATNPMFQRLAQKGIGTLWSAASPFEFGAATRLPAKPAPQ